MRPGGRPDDGFVKAFFNRHGDGVKCGKDQDATHLNLLGGKQRIPDALNASFLTAFAADLGGPYRHCYTEVVSDVAPYFIDLDVFRTDLAPEECQGAAVMGMVAGWCASSARAIARAVRDDDADHDDDAPTAVAGAVLPRDACVVMTAPPRAVLKQGKTGTKLGVHVLWPNVLVTKPQAMRLREMVVADLYEDFPDGAWQEVVDVAVYRPMASLRMVGAFKPVKCSVCDTEATKAAKKHEIKNRAAVAAALGVSDVSNPYAVVRAIRAGRQNGSKEALIKAYYEAFAAYSGCRQCGGRGRIADAAVGVYNAIVVLDGRAEVIEAATEAVREDPCAAVELCSVRRPAGTRPTPIVFPAGAPHPLDREVDHVEDRDDLTSEGKERLLPPRAPKIPGETRANREPVYADVDRIRGLVQGWLRKGGMGRQYELINVADVYRLLRRTKDPKYKQVDGGDPYSVVVIVRGYGAHTCAAAGREHGSNHIFFIIGEDGNVTQRCHAEACAGKACSPPIKLHHSVYTVLFPFTAKTINVLPAEKQDWCAGRITHDELEQMVGRRIKHMSRTDEGAAFKILVQLHRHRRARESKAKRDASNLGKHVRDDEQDGGCDMDLDLYMGDDE